MVLGDPWQAHQRTQSFHFPSSFINHSTIACCSSAQTPCSCKCNTWTLDRLSERVDALGLRAVEVIICMITRDFSVISIDVTGVSLSLSLSLSQKSLTHNIGSASALPIILVLSHADLFHFILFCSHGSGARLVPTYSLFASINNMLLALTDGQNSSLVALSWSTLACLWW